MDLNKRKKPGFALLDIILGIALFAIVIIYTVPTLLYGQESAMLEGKRQRAIKYSQAGLEIVRNIRDNDFENISPGTFGLQENSAGWSLYGSSDTNGEFTRKINIESIDEDSYKIISTVNWEQNRQRHGEVFLETTITNYQEEIENNGGNDTVTYTYEIAFDWVTGYCAYFDVETESEEEVLWEIEIDLSEEPLNGEPYNVWSSVSSYSEPILTVSGPSWKETISKDNGHSFGFCSYRPEPIVPDLPLALLDVISQPNDNSKLKTKSVNLETYSEAIEGDLIVLLVAYDGNSNFDMQRDGGQDWNPIFNKVNNNNNLQTQMYVAIFNGTWSNTPRFRFDSNKNSVSIISYYFRNNNTDWAIDTWESSGTFSATTNPYDVTIDEVNTYQDGSMVLAFWIANDDNEWYLQNLDWNQLGETQYRNSNGGISVSSAYKVLETSGNSGDVVNRVIPAGNTNGNWHIFSIKKK